jgi:hypothetical protein
MFLEKVSIGNRISKIVKATPSAGIQRAML